MNSKKPENFQVKKYRIKRNGLSFLIIEEPTGWCFVKQILDGKLSKTRFRSMDKISALQYIFQNELRSNGEPIDIDDLETLADGEQF